MVFIVSPFLACHWFSLSGWLTLYVYKIINAGILSRSFFTFLPFFSLNAVSCYGVKTYGMKLFLLTLFIPVFYNHIVRDPGRGSPQEIRLLQLCFNSLDSNIKIFALFFYADIFPACPYAGNCCGERASKRIKDYLTFFAVVG